MQHILLIMTTIQRYVSDPNTVYNLGSHIVFCTKYRRSVLIDGVDTRLKELLLEKASELDITLDIIEVKPNYVHLFIENKPIYAIHFVINQLKGYSYSTLYKEFPCIKSKIPTLWTRSYLVDNNKKLSDKDIEDYVNSQPRSFKKKLCTPLV